MTARFNVITDSPGIDTAERWSERFEGADYEVAVSVIHLSTTNVEWDRRCTPTPTRRS